VGCIWSCPVNQMLRFPMATMIRFCHNHGLLQITDRPQWHTVRGGARNYVRRMLASIADARLDTPVRRVRRRPDGGAEVTTDAGTERAVLGAVRYHPNRAVLHTDTRVLPRRKRAWAAWNYERAPNADRESASVCLHYLLNRLQPLPFAVPVILSLNPIAEPAAESVHGEFAYSHPVFDGAAMAAQDQLPSLQGVRDTWYCGAWTRYGFHEDGLASGLAVAEQIATHSRRGERTASPMAASA
ncbi:MAG: NAD/FAD-binding protein, partial [Caldimonas sp.]